jgi:TetR/AcrR family transcriptional regulator, regulator of autoinduction and epiphytic fitness
VFAARGYSASTIADVAHAAGVAIPTVYKLYGNKRTLMSAIADSWEQEFAPVRGTEEVPGDPAAALAFWAEVVRKQWETGLDIALIYAGAVTSEPEIRNELQPRLDAREQMIRTVSERLEPVLRDELTATDAAAIISALTLPEVYRDLVRERGWTPDRFQSWLERTLATQLIALGTPRPGQVLANAEAPADDRRPDRDGNTR